MTRTVRLIAIVLLGLFARYTHAADQPIQADRTPLFVAGVDGYHTYRIPALTVTSKGSVLAFCEGRRGGAGDAGDIDLLIKRSLDNGQTWSAQAIVWDDANNTCGNPCPIVDRDTGTIWLLMTWNLGRDRESQIKDQTSQDTRRVYVTHSRDDGVTWAEPTEITSTTKRENWTWYATGPGAGIQIEHGKYRGRLVAPCDHIEAQTKHFYSHVIYSDDQGKTWQLGGRTAQAQVNECEVVEIADGKLLLNMRNYDRAHKARQIAVSEDGGLTWRDQRFDEALIEPICQASVRRVRWPDGDKPGILLFSNPADQDQRANMTVRVSLDDGATWPHSAILHAGPSAYSDLTVLPSGQIGCLYERGESKPYDMIEFCSFELSALDAGL
ncbi:MAG: exo-alpha-sialidase [Planctomycetales bacterium]|nr:exo-alpha-sialidase [Planctomycetales bacterium]